MFDLGDDLIFRSHRIPWLIWIQLLVMLLLVVLLYHFRALIMGLDFSANASAANGASSSAALLASDVGLPGDRSLHAATTVNIGILGAKVDDNQRSIKSDLGGSTTRRRAIRRESVQEREGGAAAKDSTHASNFSYHPCSYFGLAKEAFLKCLGLDSTSASPSNTRQGKEE